jgi:DNA polymerase-3 subunit beta
LVKEPYPDYASVIPQDNTKTFAVDRKAFLSSINRVLLFSNSLTHQIKVTLGKEIKVAAEDVDAGGQAVELVDGKFDGDAMEIGFNGKYLAETLKSVIAETVSFSLSISTRAVIMKPVGDAEGGESLSLVMPVRLTS